MKFWSLRKRDRACIDFKILSGNFHKICCSQSLELPHSGSFNNGLQHTFVRNSNMT